MEPSSYVVDDSSIKNPGCPCYDQGMVSGPARGANGSARWINCMTCSRRVVTGHRNGVGQWAVFFVAALYTGFGETLRALHRRAIATTSRKIPIRTSKAPVARYNDSSEDSSEEEKLKLLRKKPVRRKPTEDQVPQKKAPVMPSRPKAASKKKNQPNAEEIRIHTEDSETSEEGEWTQVQGSSTRSSSARDGDYVPPPEYTTPSGKQRMLVGPYRRWRFDQMADSQNKDVLIFCKECIEHDDGTQEYPARNLVDYLYHKMSVGTWPPHGSFPEFRHDLVQRPSVPDVEDPPRR